MESVSGEVAAVYHHRRAQREAARAVSVTGETI